MNKEQIEPILNQLKQINPSLSIEGAKTLTKLKQQVARMDEHEINQQTDHVVTRLATKSEKDETIGSLFLSLYDELERVARHENDELLADVITGIQYMLQIEEKDGYFP